MGLVDELAEEGKLREAAVAFARRCVAENKPLVRVRDNNSKVEAARGKPEIFEAFRKANARKFRGFLAPEYNIRCIEAAVNPDSTDYVFFVADGTGGHAFAETLDEHNRNVARWRAIEAERGNN